MRHILIGAAAFAACGFIASTSANAQSAPPYEPGGPVQISGWCLVNTDRDGGDKFGYYAPCGQRALAEAPRRHYRH